MQSSNTKCAHVKTMHTGEMHIHIVFYYVYGILMYSSATTNWRTSHYGTSDFFFLLKKSYSTIILTVYSIIYKRHVFKFNTILL